MQGKRKIDLDRSLIGHPNIYSHIRQESRIVFDNKIDIIHYPKAPTEYSILACLTKYEVDTFDYFCSEFGYDTDSRKAKKIYKAVKKEWMNICSIWSSEEIEDLQEIN